MCLGSAGIGPRLCRTNKWVCLLRAKGNEVADHYAKLGAQQLAALVPSSWLQEYRWRHADTKTVGSMLPEC